MGDHCDFSTGLPWTRPDYSEVAQLGLLSVLKTMFSYLLPLGSLLVVDRLSPLSLSPAAASVSWQEFPPWTGSSPWKRHFFTSFSNLVTGLLMAAAGGR